MVGKKLTFKFIRTFIENVKIKIYLISLIQLKTLFSYISLLSLLILICLIIQFNNIFSDQYALAKVYYDEDSKDNDDEDDEDLKDNDDEDD
ncbi:MAG: hypothetical protein QOK67_06580, partial [Nitrososphaeraceae archaeon]|nr:hypothetical protein [Nitrososphaeraceae archaeon]